jgi:hypothetical protein
MTVSRGTVTIAAGIAFLTAAAWATVRAQGLGPSAGGSLAELTAEVRQLRAVIQEAARSQTQVQGLSLALTSQQSRLGQVGTRLEKIDEELRAASAKTGEAKRALAEAESSAANAVTPSELKSSQLDVRLAKAAVDRLVEEENQVRLRQTEHVAAFRAEEARWVELVARLEEVIKR